MSTGTPDYRHSDSDNRVSKEYSENYILLSGSFNIPEEYDSLMVRTDNNKLRIKANGDVLLDSLGIEGMFTGNKANYVNLPGDGNRDVDIEIILYTPFSYNADIYLINSVYLDENIPAGILYDIIAGIIFAIPLRCFQFQYRQCKTCVQRISSKYQAIFSVHPLC